LEGASFKAVLWHLPKETKENYKEPNQDSLAEIQTPEYKYGTLLLHQPAFGQ
jgi:hypothetical protein